jgi:hypothetical protein
MSKYICFIKLKHLIFINGKNTHVFLENQGFTPVLFPRNNETAQ